MTEKTDPAWPEFDGGSIKKFRRDWQAHFTGPGAPDDVRILREFVFSGCAAEVDGEPVEHAHVPGGNGAVFSTKRRDSSDES